MGKRFYFGIKKYEFAEISIILPNRTLGSSKMSLNDIFYGMIYLLKTFVIFKL